MADKMNPEVEIVLDKPRHLLVSMGALLRFKKETGKDPLKKEVMSQISEDLINRTLTEDIFILIWACLRHEDKTLTIEQVEDAITPGNLGAVSDKLFEAFQAAMPEVKSGEADAGPLAQSPRAG